MSLNELTSASCINIMLTKWVQVSIPLLNLSVLCFFTTLENLERLINPNICAKILILDLDMVFVLVSNPKLGKTLPCPFFILDACGFFINRVYVSKVRTTESISLFSNDAKNGSSIFFPFVIFVYCEYGLIVSSKFNTRLFNEGILYSSIFIKYFVELCIIVLE